MKFTCDADEGTTDNTATIDETGASDSASVRVNCYDLAVTRNAATSLTRTWSWTIEKVGDQTALTRSTGQTFVVNYDVMVDASSTDSKYAVSGGITISNPAPIAATITSVSDIVSPTIAAMVDCGVGFPYSLAPNGVLNCTYTAALPDASSRTSTATATLQNYNYDKDGIATASGTTDFSGTANVAFGSATINKVDECIEVTDDKYGDLSEVCASGSPFSYTFE